MCNKKMGTNTSVSTLQDTDNSDLCKVCKIQTCEQWIQCDICQSWHHRKCVGLSNVLKWKKFLVQGHSGFVKTANKYVKTVNMYLNLWECFGCL